MGLFGFGRKRHKKDDEAAKAEETKDEELDQTEDEDAEAEEAEDSEAGDADENDAEDEAEDSEEDEDDSEDDDSDDDDDDSDDEDEYSDTYDDLEPGPWDYDADDVDPDFNDKYISFGSMFLPIVDGMTIRARRHPQLGIQSITISWGKSSLEVVPYAAPKTMGLWGDVSDELLESTDGATVSEGRFGDEVILPVTVNGKTMTTRVVGVDGPRWMLRGIFSGPAADIEKDSEERTVLEDYFSHIIVRRGSEPMAPQDILQILPPKTGAQRRAEAKAAADAAKKKASQAPKNDTDVPQNYDVEHKVQTTMRRGPMFSEMR
ncbi:MAG: DUF3710 domain-containing protein [Bifidobacteriaceae bacterium]|nr:DUF3710 domain-containing protein [Bifidobacteriaceae bacterium]